MSDTSKKPVSPSHAQILGAAATVRPIIEKQVDAMLAGLEVSLEKNPQPYYKASRYILRGIIVAAAQRLFKDGADKNVVFQAIDAWGTTEDAWLLFLSEHPEVAAKVEGEKKAKMAQAALHMVDPEEEEEEEEDEEEDEDEPGTVDCEECGEAIPEDAEAISPFHKESCSCYSKPKDD